MERTKSGAVIATRWEREQAEHGHCHRHGLGANSFDGAFVDGVEEVGPGADAVLSAAAVEGVLAAQAPKKGDEPVRPIVETAWNWHRRRPDGYGK